MKSAGWQFVRRWGLEITLLASLLSLGWALFMMLPPADASIVPSMRSADFPETYISRIHLDLTSPNHFVQLTWQGPRASAQDRGPFRSCPGRGWGDNNCGDPVESNCPGSNCTPIGLRKVEGHQEHLESSPTYRYVTLIDSRRAIGFHAHDSLPPYPDSQGCVRLTPAAARLIYDNSIAGKTEILVDGAWTNPSLNDKSPPRPAIDEKQNL
jgi:hypothetical protein